MTRIYLDHAATTPIRAEALAAMRDGFALWANPSSPHAEGRTARAALEDARSRVKTALGWQGELIFTSGASEALAIALGRAKMARQIVSAVEHDAVFRAAPGAQVIPVGPDWVVDRAVLADLLAQGPAAAVAVQHVNSETGAMQPISDLAVQVRAAGGVLISDCSQSAGKFPLPDADMIVVSAHKLGGPVGIGALLVRDFALLEPTGGHERGYRAGTENLPAAVGFAVAMEMAARDRDAGPGGGEGFGPAWSQNAARVLMESGLLVLTAPGGTTGEAKDGAIHSVSMPGLSAQAQLIRFDAAGIAVSAGSACSSGTLKPSRVLLAFGVEEAVARNAIRVSFGHDTTADHVARFVDLWQGMSGKAP